MEARSCERLGRLLEARSLYQRVLDEPLAATAPRAFQQAQADAKAELAALAPRIPTLEVALGRTPQGAVELTLDGERIAPAKTVDVDPGEHTLSGVVPGRPPVNRTIRLDERAKAYIVLDLAPPPAEARPERSAPATSGDDLRKSLFIGGGVAAGVGVIAGTAFTLLYSGKAVDAENLRQRIRSGAAPERYCPDPRSPSICAELNDTVDTQYVFANVALGSFILGAAGVGAVIYALVDRPSAPVRRAHVAPLVGSGVAGLSLSGRF
ncbi:MULTISPECIES: hypothetical protein [Sorangium]|nr:MULTISPECIES: hypothetical protein [Sorangium]